jgi:hypothetical protein
VALRIIAAHKQPSLLKKSVFLESILLAVTIPCCATDRSRAGERAGR